MMIIKRKKGKKTYFYLKHSIRKDSKIISIEKYLGASIPKDIEGIKRDFVKRLNLDVDTDLRAIKKNFQANWKNLPSSVKEKNKEEIAITFTYNTNAIEGSTITLDETRGIVHDKIAPNKPIRDIKETEAHSRVFLEMLNKREDISSSLILKWHKEIFQETKQDIAGKFRKYLVTIGGHIPPDWRKVRREMKNINLYMRRSKRDGMNPVELAAKVHYRFEKLHPFGDGNGRIGRLVMNHILWHRGYPMLIIEKKRRTAYYKSLRGDENKFVKYFIRRYLKAHKKFLLMR